MSAASEIAEAGAPDAWRATLSGLCASLVGIGLARFAYTPLLPAIIAAQWFSAADAAYLGAANLAGYLAGALLAAPLARRVAAATILKGMMLLAAIAFFACAWPIGFAWFFAWRFASGLSGGALMVLTAPTVLPHVAPARRGIAMGAIFMGIGLGIAASGTLVPLLLQRGLTLTWIGLGALASILTVVAWRGWPGHDAAPAPPAERVDRAERKLPLRALYAAYALDAVGLVPHMIFLVDFVARGSGQGLQAGAIVWVLFGLGAILGPLLAGKLADHIGFGRALRGALLIQAIAVLLPVLHLGAAWLAVSSLLVGAFVPGIVVLVLGRISELMAGDAAAQKQAWSRATTAFAIFQALSAYGMSFLFDRSGGDYGLLFVLGTGALLLALAIDVAAGSHPAAKADGGQR